jgi:hypothetical protein
MKTLDEQFRPYAPRTVEVLKIPYEQANSLATTIFQEITHADDAQLLSDLEGSSPLSLKHRLFFFENYQIWEGFIAPKLTCPSSHVLPAERVSNSFHEMLAIIQIYVSFVFAGDGLFQVLAKKAPKNSCVRKCSHYIRENPLRALRNAVAHGNWHLVYPNSLRYWARKGPDPNEPLTQFDATADDMNFYLSLTRCVAWATLLSINEKSGAAESGLSYA